MAAGFSVQIVDLRSAAAAFAELHVQATQRLSVSALVETGGMAGRDPVLAAWRARYDAVAAAEWAASGAAATVLGAIATKLTATADTYLTAENTATTALGDQADRPPPRRAPADRGVEPFPAGPPSSTGSGGPAVPDALAAYFPGGDPATLRVAAAAWTRWAEGTDSIASAGDASFRALLDTGDGATFSAMRTFWSGQFAPCAPDALFNAVENGARVLSASCAALADLIDDARAAIPRAARDAAVDMSPLELPALLLGKVAWGIPELELLLGTGALAVAYVDDHRNAYLFALDRLVEKLSVDEEQRLRRVAVPPLPDAPPGVGLTDVGRIAGLELAGTRWDALVGAHPTPDTIHVTPAVVTHILTGDKKGGGHAPGAGRPGKNEFPRGWSDQQIVAAALDVARNPGTVTTARIKHRWVATAFRNGVQMRVIVDDDGSLTTAIPWSGPGVTTNPS